MPQYNRVELGRMATESGFVRDTFEKVLRLKEILRFMNEEEFLREHLLLKGGTAINLTVFNLLDYQWILIWIILLMIPERICLNVGRKSRM